MSEPNPRDTQAETTRWVFHSDGGGWSDIFVDGKYAGRMRTPVAKLAGDCVNAHDKLVEACLAAFDFVDSGGEDGSPLKIIKQLTAALAAADKE